MRHGLVVANRAGAAVGEVLGKKASEAMVWGAVAGTFDMDVLGQFLLNELDNLAFHRGISHSFTATVLGPLFFGWTTDRLYRSPHHAKIASGGQGVCSRCPRICGEFPDPNLFTGGMAGGAVRPIGGMDFLAARQAPLLQRHVEATGDRFQGLVQLFSGLPDAHFARLLYHVRDAGVCAVQ